MKRLWVFLLACILMLGCPAFAVLAQEDEEETDLAAREEWDRVYGDVLNGLDFSQMDSALNGLGEPGYQLLGASVREAVMKASQGELKLDIWGILKLIFASAVDAFRKNAGILLRILLLAVISAILGVLKPSFSSQGVADAAGMVSYLLIIAILAQLLYSVVGVARDAIDAMSGVISAVFPILLLLLTAMGGSMSGAVFSPAMAVLTGGIGLFIKNAILPMVLISGVMIMVSNISERVQIGKMAAFVKKIAGWSISVVFVVFLGVTALQGMAGSTIDGVTLRTAKFAIDKFVPIVGGMFSDTVDTLIGCSLVIKNGIGIVGTLMIAVSVLSPVLTIASLSLMMNLAAAIIEPFGEKRIYKCLSDISGVMTLLYVSILALGAMMFILVSLVVGASNVNIMMR
ncbi:stage III sporulation protein AE [Christensenella sp. MSJ-20]|uniref:stage III sporulation protein AE n=1 Tax=Christensenella sp. MSJ-20 TaxID=2841518 RepID=UPI001C75628B|nr:stage III sporulation protein AE [Christensenella sp. MSJ-20]